MIKLKKNTPTEQDIDSEEAGQSAEESEVKVKKTRKIKSKSEPKAKAGTGKVIGLVVLLLLAGGGAAVYLNPDLAGSISVALGLSEEVAEDADTPIPAPKPAGTGANNATQPQTAPAAATSQPAPTGDTPPAPVAFEAQAEAANTLNMAKIWVQARMSKGMNLLDINESIPLSSVDKQHWQSIQVNQGTISAVHINSTPDNPTILMPLQNGNQITWVCAGAIPAALESICQ